MGTQNLVDTVGRVLDPRYKPDWQAIHASAGGAADLMARLEGYGATLAHNMLQLFTQPFDAVHNNIGMCTQKLISLWCVKRKDHIAISGQCI